MPVYAADPGAPALNAWYQTEGLLTLNQARRLPRWRASLDARWTKGRWSANWATRFVGSSRERCGLPAEFGQCNEDLENLPLGARSIGSTTYHDLRLSYQWKQILLTAGVRNLFDKGPPLSSVEPSNYYADEYRVPGRFPYLRLEYRPGT